MIVCRFAWALCGFGLMQLGSCGGGSGESAADSEEVSAGIQWNGDTESFWAEVGASIEKPPEELTSFSVSELDRIHRSMCVDRWNHKGDQGMRHGSRYGEMANVLDMHVDLLEAADDYIHYVRVPAVGEALREALGSDPELIPDYYHPVTETAFLGTYTVHAAIQIAACPNKVDLDPYVDAAASRLEDLIPPFSGGFKVWRIEYSCPDHGDKRSLNYGLLWKRGESSPRRMEKCSGTGSKEFPHRTTKWSWRTWNEMNPLEE